MMIDGLMVRRCSTYESASMVQPPVSLAAAMATTAGERTGRCQEQYSGERYLQADERRTSDDLGRKEPSRASNIRPRPEGKYSEGRSDEEEQRRNYAKDRLHNWGYIERRPRLICLPGAIPAKRQLLSFIKKCVIHNREPWEFMTEQNRRNTRGRRKQQACVVVYPTYAIESVTLTCIATLNMTLTSVVVQDLFAKCQAGPTNNMKDARSVY